MPHRCRTSRDAIGIQKGSVYHYIRTKEDLLYAIIDNLHDQMFSLNVTWKAVTGDSLAQIRSFVEGMLGHLFKASNTLRSIFEIFAPSVRSIGPRLSRIATATRPSFALSSRRLPIKDCFVTSLTPDSRLV